MYMILCIIIVVCTVKYCNVLMYWCMYVCMNEWMKEWMNEWMYSQCIRTIVYECGQVMRNHTSRSLELDVALPKPNAVAWTSHWPLLEDVTASCFSIIFACSDRSRDSPKQPQAAMPKHEAGKNHSPSSKYFRTLTTRSIIGLMRIPGFSLLQGQNSASRIRGA